MRDICVLLTCLAVVGDGYRRLVKPAETRTSVGTEEPVDLYRRADDTLGTTTLQPLKPLAALLLAAEDGADTAFRVLGMPPAIPLRSRMAAQPRMMADRDIKVSEEAAQARLFLGANATTAEQILKNKYSALLDAYKDDEDMVEKIEGAWETILEDNERREVARQAAQAAAATEAEKKPLFKFKFPQPPLPPFMEWPTGGMVLKNFALFSINGAMPAFSRSFTSSSLVLGYCLGFWLMYNRDLEMKFTEMTQDMALRKYKAVPVLITAAVTGAAGALGFLASFCVPAARVAYLTPGLCTSLATSFGYFMSSTFFKAQDFGGKGDEDDEYDDEDGEKPLFSVGESGLFDD